MLHLRRSARHSGASRNPPLPPAPAACTSARHSGASRNLPCLSNVRRPHQRPSFRLAPESPLPPKSQFSPIPNPVTPAPCASPRQCANLIPSQESTRLCQRRPSPAGSTATCQHQIATGPNRTCRLSTKERGLLEPQGKPTPWARPSGGPENPSAERPPNSAAQNSCVTPPAVGLTHRPGNPSSGRAPGSPTTQGAIKIPIVNRTHRNYPPAGCLPLPDHRPAARPTRRLAYDLNPPTAQPTAARPTCRPRRPTLRVAARHPQRRPSRGRRQLPGAPTRPAFLNPDGITPGPPVASCAIRLAPARQSHG